MLGLRVQGSVVSREYSKDYTTLRQVPLHPPLRSLGKPSTDSSSCRSQVSTVEEPLPVVTWLLKPRRPAAGRDQGLGLGWGFRVEGV